MLPYGFWVSSTGKVPAARVPVAGSVGYTTSVEITTPSFIVTGMSTGWLTP